MKYVGRVEVRLHIFVSLELDGGEWSGTQSGNFSLKTRYGRGGSTAVQYGKKKYSKMQKISWKNL